MSLIIRAFAVFVSLWALACSSDRYTLQDKAGPTIRLDKRTGDIAVLSGDHLVLVKELEGAAGDTILSKPRHWPVDSVGSKVKISAVVSTRWGAGKLFYQIRLGPAPDELTTAREVPGSRITLYLQDSAGFNLAEVPVPLKEMLRINYPAATELFANASSELDADVYRETKRVVLSWAGF